MVEAVLEPALVVWWWGFTLENGLEKVLCRAANTKTSKESIVLWKETGVFVEKRQTPHIYNMI